MNFGHPAVNSGSFPPHRSSQPVSYDDYFPHNQNKNDLAKTRSFLVRVERVELWILVIKKTLNRANLGSVEPRCRVATVVSDRLISSTLSSSWATGGQHQLGRGQSRMRRLTYCVGLLLGQQRRSPEPEVRQALTSWHLSH